MTTKGEAAMNANGKCEVVRQFARRGLALAALLAMVLFGADVTRAQSSATAAVSPTVGQPAAPRKAPASRSGGMEAGIKLHGHWTIIVRNPDGTVTARRDFENSLTFDGAYLMQNLLAGTMTPGAWAISLGAQLPGDTGPCNGVYLNINNSVVPTPVSTGNCYIAEASGAYGNLNYQLAQCTQGDGCAPNLTRQQIKFRTTTLVGTLSSRQVVSSSGFELTGTATAGTNGTIDTVATLLMVCTDGDEAGLFVGTITVIDTMSGVNPNTCSYPPPPTGGDLFKGFPVGISSDFGTVFTSAILNGASATSTPPAAVQVIANQTIQVTVVFTFN
ncbi:MAG TPA: hypothetical protein VMF91_10915 [Bryobacteraceae bacterium]|nr:hypothetical protein [Bryobacteraceae bacterium]